MSGVGYDDVRSRMSVRALINVEEAVGQGVERIRELSSSQEDGCQGSKTSLTCPECDEVFKFKGKLLYHRFQAHGVQCVVSQCDECKLGFGRRSDYRKHILTVHEKYRPFGCTKCKSTFYLRKDLAKHTATVHDKSKQSGSKICAVPSNKGQLGTHIRAVHNVT